MNPSSRSNSSSRVLRGSNPDIVLETSSREFSYLGNEDEATSPRGEQKGMWGFGGGANQGKGGEIVLSYYDSALQLDDVVLLATPCEFLNDKLITFYFEYLTHEKFKGGNEGRAGGDQEAGDVHPLLFMHPSASFFASQCQEPQAAALVLDPLRLLDRELVFIPVNDNRNVNEPGGMHWSLLVMNVKNMSFAHYDSCTGTNFMSAMTYARAIFQYLYHCLKQQQDRPSASPRLNFTAPPSPQQNNGYDCGVYVLAITDHLAQEWVNSRKQNAGNEGSTGTATNLAPSDLANFITPYDVTKFRKDLLDIVKKLARRSGN
eukprot:Nk52_evm33s621 gene=Nk52_evmTU33s621